MSKKYRELLQQMSSRKIQLELENERLKKSLKASQKSMYDIVKEAKTERGVK